MINAAAAEVGHGIVGVTVGEGVPPPVIDVAEGPAPEPAPAQAESQAEPEPEPAPEPEKATRARRGPLSLSQRLEEMRGMYERRIARKRAIETRLAAELATLRASIGEDEAELSTLSTGRASE